MLSLRQICKSYPNHKQQILDNIDLEVASGESVAIMGASGSGKSSLLSIVSGLTACDSGTLCFNNKTLSHTQPADFDNFRLHQLGLVFQQFNLIECLSVRDNISLPARYMGFDYQHKLIQLADKLAISQLLDAKVTALSGGEQQRVAIARALLHGPQLILADEPTGNLDNQTADIVATLLFEQTRSSDTAMLIVTHSEDVASRADRILHLKDGKLMP